MKKSYKVKNGLLDEIKGYEFNRVKASENVQLSFFDGLSQENKKDNSITIPYNVTSINLLALRLEGLQSIYVDAQNETFCSIDGLLCSKDGTVLVAAPYGREKVIIPNSIKRIGDGAFEYNNSVKEIFIPQGLEEIGHCAFGYCRNLEKINIPETVTIIKEAAFINTKSLKCITLPEKITEINNGMFDMSGITSINIPQRVIRIGNNAFSSCQIEKIALPDGLETIENGAFQCNHALKHFSIPSRIKRIAFDAFFYTPAEELINSIREYISSGKIWSANRIEI